MTNTLEMNMGIIPINDAIKTYLSIIRMTR